MRPGLGVLASAATEDTLRTADRAAFDGRYHSTNASVNAGLLNRCFHTLQILLPIDHRSHHPSTQADRTGRTYAATKLDWRGLAADRLKLGYSDGLAVSSFWSGAKPADRDLLLPDTT